MSLTKPVSPYAALSPDSFLQSIPTDAVWPRPDVPHESPEARGTARKGLVELDRQLARMPREVVLSGGGLTITEVLAVARHGAKVYFTEDAMVLLPTEWVENRG
jgi:hypothetical protein